MCVIDRLATQDLQYNMNIVEGGKQAEPSSERPASRPNHPTNRMSQDSEPDRRRKSSDTVSGWAMVPNPVFVLLPLRGSA